MSGDRPRTQAPAAQKGNVGSDEHGIYFVPGRSAPRDKKLGQLTKIPAVGFDGILGQALLNRDHGEKGVNVGAERFFHLGERGFDRELGEFRQPGPDLESSARFHR